MADRSLLHKNKLQEFREWCSTQGIECRDGRGEYQVLQVCLLGKWYALYERAYMPEHLTVPLQLIKLARRFLSDSKRARAEEGQ